MCGFRTVMWVEAQLMGFTCRSWFGPFRDAGRLAVVPESWLVNWASYHDNRLPMETNNAEPTRGTL